MLSVRYCKKTKRIALGTSLNNHACLCVPGGGGAGDTPRASACHHFQPDSQSKCGQTVTMETSLHTNSISVVFKVVIFKTGKVKIALRPANLNGNHIFTKCS